MITACPAWDPSLSPVLRMAQFVGCRTQALGENGYRAIATSPLFLSVMGGLLTLSVGYFGFRLLLGERLDTGRALSAVLRIGVVLTLATSWPAYQALIDRVVVEGSGEISAILLPAAGAERSGASINRLDAVYASLTRAEEPHLAPLAPASPAQANPAQAGAAGATGNTPEQHGLDLAGAGQAATAALFLISTVGSWLMVRFLAGLLLALGPFFACGLLFAASEGLFLGWMRTLSGLVIVGIGLDLATALECAVLEAQLPAPSAALAADPAAIDWTLLFAIVAIFALLLLCVFVMGFRVTALVSRPILRMVQAPWREAGSPETPFAPVNAPALAPARASATGDIGAAPRSGAAAISSAIRTLEQREQIAAQRHGANSFASEVNATSPATSARRRAQAPRTSASHMRRDAL